MVKNVQTVGYDGACTLFWILNLEPLNGIKFLCKKKVPESKFGSWHRVCGCGR